MSLVDDKGNPLQESEQLELPGTEMPTEEEAPEQQQAPQDWRAELPKDVHAAYAVFINKKGEISFTHAAPGVIELIGLHEIAHRNIDLMLNRASGQDTTQALNVIGRMLQTILQMLTNNSRQQFDMLKK